MSEDDTLLRAEGIVKSFPGVLALNGARFDLRRGEVHALLGENGAGKSTLMKILGGVFRPDAGTVAYKGRVVHFPDAGAARDAGISVIHQELNLVGHLSVAQNIYLGREPRRLGGLLVDDARMVRDAAKLLERLRCDVDPRTSVERLPVSTQQLVEIAKALAFRCEVLIMDEPTSALTDKETDRLFELIDELKTHGVGIVYISHRLEELARIADRATVFRDGAYVDTLPFRETTIDHLVRLMVGREITSQFPPKTRAARHHDVLDVRGLRLADGDPEISFRVRAGEIVGVAGLMGAGRTEMARAIFGADPRAAGEIRVEGRAVKVRTPADAIKAGIAYLPEDRKRHGLALAMSIRHNITLANLPKVSGRFGHIRQGGEGVASSRFVKDLRIRTPGTEQLARNLSGGNQQKVVLAKWLFRDAKVLIFDEPTRGVDIGAKYAIYELMDELAARGAAILMISSDLPEVLGMSDRVLVMCHGRLAADLERGEADQERILRHASGLECV